MQIIILKFISENTYLINLKKNINITYFYSFCILLIVIKKDRKTLNL